MSTPRLHALILAGGAGERFWPASRRRQPKPFLRLVEGRSLLDETLVRARRCAGAERVWAVCGREHAAALRRATGLPRERVLVEPERRNTALAIAWAARCIQAEDPEAVLVVLPADHHIPDAALFAREIRRAAQAAQRSGALVTLGIRPTRPDTGYGYIQLGPAAGREFPGLRHVRRFVEKPPLAKARAMLRRGDHLWNAGIFVFRADRLLEELALHAPEIAVCVPRARTGAALRAAYRRAPAEPIDTAVFERSERVWTLPVDFHWSDLGTWLSLAAELGVAPGASRVLGGEVLFDELGGNLVWGRNRPIALLGVRGLAVVDSGDALLVTSLEASPGVRAVVKRLEARGRRELL